MYVAMYIQVHSPQGKVPYMGSYAAYVQEVPQLQPCSDSYTRLAREGFTPTRVVTVAGVVVLVPFAPWFPFESLVVLASARY